MVDLREQLNNILSLANPKEKLAELKSVLERVLASPNAVTEAETYFSSILHESINAAISREILQDFQRETTRLVPQLARPVLTALVQLLQQRGMVFEDLAWTFREILATLLEVETDWAAAAKVLAGISAESGHRVVSDEAKLALYLRIAECFLRVGDSTNADAFINRAATLIPSCQDSTLLLRYKVSYVTNMDYKRKFLEASLKYLELSYVAKDEETERSALHDAVVCVLLAQAGPQRSRALANLYKDERSTRLVLFDVLEKV